MKNSLQEYTEKEFLQLLFESEYDNYPTEDLDNLVIFFNEKIAHPSGSDLIMYPTSIEIEDTPKSIVREIKRWYDEQGLKCFKDS